MSESAATSPRGAWRFTPGPGSRPEWRKLSFVAIVMIYAIVSIPMLGLQSMSSIIFDFTEQRSQMQILSAERSTPISSTDEEDALKRQLSKLKEQLQDESNKVTDLQSNVEAIETEKKTLVGAMKLVKQDLENKQKMLDEKAHEATAVSGTEPSTNFCEALGSESAMSMWTKHIGNIFNASQHVFDRKEYTLHDDTAHVLKLLTPRLPMAQRSVPRDWATLHAIMEKVQKRYHYLVGEEEEKDSNRKNNEEEPDPIRILVLGGSVSMGVNCFTRVRKYDTRNCAWASRLDNLLNKLVIDLTGGKGPRGKKKLFEVSNLSVGGSNTETGRVLLKYDLIPEDVMAATPDIIINAYATNDMHVLTMKEAKNNNVTLREITFRNAQEFARIALRLCMSGTSPSGGAAPPPLLLWLDDYLGNEQREIMRTTELSQGIQVLANYYGFGFMSYADAVRDLVYGTTKERMFSPAGWYRIDAKTGVRGPKMSREIHPGWTMHLATTYVVSYYLLQLGTTYCQLEPWEVHKMEQSLFDPKAAAAVSGFPSLRGTHRGNKTDAVAGTSQFEDLDRPRPRPKGLPPRLDDALTITDITERWESESALASEESGQQQVPISCRVDSSSLGLRQCPLSWVSGISYSDNPKFESLTKEYLQPYWVVDQKDQKNGTGWELMADDWKKQKYGFIPSRVGDKMTLQVNVTQQDIHSVTIFYLRSYGPKWKNATAEVQVYTDGGGDRHSSKPLVARTLDGTHDKNTSETYTQEIELPKPARKQVQLQFELTGGSTFKITGFAICS